MFFQQLANGLAIGSIYSLAAVGYSMVYGVLGLINFANNAFMMGGAYLLILSCLERFTSMDYSYTRCSVVRCWSYDHGGVSFRYIRNIGSSDISALICTVGYSTVIINWRYLFWVTDQSVQPFHFDMITIGNMMLDPCSYNPGNSRYYDDYTLLYHL